MAIACYGKFPISGDFVTLGDIEPFSVLREWLHAAFVAAASRLSEGWGTAYRTAPMWRFAATDGVFARNAVIGVMTPSVDSVGRLFPAVVIALAQHRDDSWYERVEETLLDVFAGRLTSMQAISDRIDALRAVEPEGAVIANPSVGSIATAGVLRPRTSWWWAQASVQSRAAARRFDALPGADDIAVLFGAPSVQAQREEPGNLTGAADAPWLVSRVEGAEALILCIFGASSEGAQAVAKVALHSQRGAAEASDLLRLAETLNRDLSGLARDQTAESEPRQFHGGVAVAYQVQNLIYVCSAGDLNIAAPDDSAASHSEGESAPFVFIRRNPREGAFQVVIRRAGAGATVSSKEWITLPQVTSSLRAGLVGSSFLVGSSP